MITNEYINQAIDYILTHINERISVDDIASHCNFSRYYFSRMFKMETGASVYEFIKRTKMEQSAFRLKVEQSRSITDVGLDYGYSASNYSSAFKEHLSLSPIAFRRSILEKSLTNPIFGNVSMGLNSFDTVAQKVSIEHLPDYTVLFERYKGNYSDLSEHWGAFRCCPICCFLSVFGHQHHILFLFHLHWKSNGIRHDILCKRTCAFTHLYIYIATTAWNDRCLACSTHYRDIDVDTKFCVYRERYRDVAEGEGRVLRGIYRGIERLTPKE